MIEIVGEVSMAAASLAPVAEAADPGWQAQQIIERGFQALETGVRWVMGAGFFIAAGFLGWGFILFNRAADNPQMMSRAKNQILFSLISAAGCAMIFLFIGAGIEIFTTALGGGEDIGDFGVVSGTQTRAQGEFLGVHNNSPVLCNSADGVSNNSDDADGLSELGWTWDAGSDADTPGKCTK